MYCCRANVPYCCKCYEENSPSTWHCQHISCWRQAFLMRQIIGVMRSKARLGLCTDLPADHEIRSEAVFSTINSVPYFVLWSFISPNLDWPLLFPFAKQRQSAKGYFAVFIKQYAAVLTRFKCFSWHSCSHPFYHLPKQTYHPTSLSFSLNYLGDLIPWMFWRMGHDIANSPYWSLHCRRASLKPVHRAMSDCPCAQSRNCCSSRWHGLYGCCCCCCTGWNSAGAGAASCWELPPPPVMADPITWPWYIETPMDG